MTIRDFFRFRRDQQVDDPRRTPEATAEAVAEAQRRYREGRRLRAGQRGEYEDDVIKGLEDGLGETTDQDQEVDR